MTYWFVSQAGAGAKDGTSEINAWDTFANIVWGGAGVVPGDTIYALDTLTDLITIGNSGTAGNLITLRGDLPGRPCIIDADKDDNNCVVLNEKDYIHIANITLRDAEFHFIWNVDSDFLSVDNVLFDNTQNCTSNGIYCNASNGEHQGITVTNSKFSLLESGGAMISFGQDGANDFWHTIKIANNYFSGLTSDACRVVDLRDRVAGQMTAGSIPYKVEILDNYAINCGGSFVNIRCKADPGDAAAYCNVIARNRIVNGGDVNMIQTHFSKKLKIQDNYIDGTFYNSDGDAHGIILDYDEDLVGGVNSDWPSDDCIVERNIIIGRDHQAPSAKGYAAAIDVWSATNCIIRYNLCYGNLNGISLQYCNVSTGNVFYNNVLANNTGYGAKITGSVGEEVPASTWTNNILCGNPVGIYKIRAVDPTLDYNCYYDNTADLTDDDAAPDMTKGANAVSADPIFVNPASAFGLRKHSPCVDAGSNVYAAVASVQALNKVHITDPNNTLIAPGGAVDIGAYEYISPEGFSSRSFGNKQRRYFGGV